MMFSFIRILNFSFVFCYLYKFGFQNLGKDVKHQAEEVSKKLWRIMIEYADNTKQVIEMFQLVKVHLKRKGNTFNLEGQLIQPDT